MLVRYLDEDNRIIQGLIDKANGYADDPYQRLLIFLKLYAELVEQMRAEAAKEGWTVIEQPVDGETSHGTGELEQDS